MSSALQRLRGEFLEMPGLRLSLAQLQRLCGVEAASCRVALDALVEARFLCRHQDGTYARVIDGLTARSRPTRAREQACSS